MQLNAKIIFLKIVLIKFLFNLGNKCTTLSYKILLINNPVPSICKEMGRNGKYREMKLRPGPLFSVIALMEE
ncbi:hypothetical protein XELAEV_18016023mg [Xenopus laevis]|uniref:Uncharacterized protein n=1 Tax=Xenopus laevis TaxID=8355 RepID=A0A974HWZ2_XENLA|nr:hypothetical protein XELAEV_18016023mg [Xenopus laevis]